MTPVSLRKLFPTASFIGCADCRVTDAYDQSGAVQPGALFAALPGTRSHGSAHLPDATRRGATAVLSDRPIPESSLPQCIVRDARTAFGRLCHALYRNPTQNLRLVGVTGTNGKTTTTYMIRAILTAAGHRAGLSGTIEVANGEQTMAARLTTPGSRELAEWAATLRRTKHQHAAMEVSSHALDQGRLSGTLLDAAIVTNLTQDHLDYHGGMAEYQAAKARIFQHLKPGGVAILNADDPRASAFRSVAEEVASIVTFGCHEGADVRARVREVSSRGTVFEVADDTATAVLRTPLIGRHNLSNALAAIAACRSLGLSFSEMEAGLGGLETVPGRMQRVETGEPFAAWIDYAHTDDGLRRAIAAVRPLIAGRLIVVFGAGGDRDVQKRPLMGQAASAADLAVITSDNPRSEVPEAIARDIQRGWPADRPDPLVILDREAAIFAAIAAAQPGDGVLIAGKGHETYQQIGAEKLPFCDRETCTRAIAARQSASRIPSPHRIGTISDTVAVVAGQADLYGADG